MKIYWSGKRSSGTLISEESFKVLSMREEIARSLKFPSVGLNRFLLVNCFLTRWVHSLGVSFEIPNPAENCEDKFFV